MDNIDGSPPLRRVAASQAKQGFGSLLRAAQGGPVAVERHGKVQAMVVAPEHFAASTHSRPDPMEQRRMARLQQLLHERERLIRHQAIAIELLAMPRAQSRKRVQQAAAMVERWRVQGLCSTDYIERWTDILHLPLPQLALALGSDLDGWGTALRQNSPWVAAQA